MSRPDTTSFTISLFSLLVHDYDEAIDFFTNKLGFRLTTDVPAVSSQTGAAKRWVVVHPPHPNSSGILLAKADGQEQKAVVGKQWAGRVGMFIQVNDFDQQYQRMKHAGVQFDEAPREEKYGRVVVFRDVAGNKWDLLGPQKPDGLSTQT